MDFYTHSSKVISLTASTLIQNHLNMRPTVRTYQNQKYNYEDKTTTEIKETQMKGAGTSIKQVKSGRISCFAYGTLHDVPLPK